MHSLSRKALFLLCGSFWLLTGCPKKVQKTTVRTESPPSSASATKGQSTSASSLKWTEVTTPYPAADITAVEKVFWICGADEMIASSSDGGNTWKLHHSAANGKILLHIAFVNEKIGHAAGKDGILLSTTNGGKGWKSHNAGDDVQAFSFADALNGIAIIGGDNDSVTYRPSWGGAPKLDGAVRITHDGGDHWEDIPSLSADEFRPFTRVLTVAALDSTHYLMLRNNRNIEDAFVVTADGGKSWRLVHQRNDDTNRELARWVFVHGGEYWAFGMELLHREKGGGYGFPLAEHSKDGLTWLHGVNGGKEFGGCSSQGCYRWAGVVEGLYGNKEQYWNLPQDFTLTNRWAIAGNHACTINTATECGPAVPIDTPQPMIWHAGGGQFDEKPIQAENLAFTPDCVKCSVTRIKLDPGLDWQGQVVANFEVDSDGSVASLLLEGKLDERLRDRLENQVHEWMFKAPSRAADASTKHKRIVIEVKCVSLPDEPAIDGCRFSLAKEIGKEAAGSTLR